MLKGMGIVMKNALRGPITVQYPHEQVELPERARWAVKPKYDEAGNPKCTACMTCVRACPDFILDLHATTAEDRSKQIEHFRYEVGACMMCGLCVEACPFDAIEMSHEYELARCDASLLAIDLLTDVPAAGPKRDRAAAAAKPAGGAKVADESAATEGDSTTPAEAQGAPAPTARESDAAKPESEPAPATESAAAETPESAVDAAPEAPAPAESEGGEPADE